MSTGTPQPANSYFTPENVFKLCGLLITATIQGCVLFFMLKTEIHDNKVLDTADKQIINFRLASLENQAAVLPKDINHMFESKKK